VGGYSFEDGGFGGGFSFSDGGDVGRLGEDGCALDDEVLRYE